MFRAPSKARLIRDLHLSPAAASVVRALIRREYSTLNKDLFPASNQYFDSCFNRPLLRERMMHCLNEVCGGHGVEALEGESFRQPAALYINMGDTYAPTILFSYKTDTFSLTTWGDFAERNLL